MKFLRELLRALILMAYGIRIPMRSGKLQENRTEIPDYRIAGAYLFSRPYIICSTIGLNLFFFLRIPIPFFGERNWKYAAILKSNFYLSVNSTSDSVIGILSKEESNEDESNVSVILVMPLLLTCILPSDTRFISFPSTSVILTFNGL